MKQWPVVKGKKVLKLGRWSSGGIRDYALYFFKGKTHVASMYFHKGVKEVVLCTPEDIVLRKETTDSFKPYFDFTMFRFTRKKIQRIIKRGRHEL